MNRRDFLVGAGALTLVPSLANAAPVQSKFRFIHATDLHIQPELGASDGVKAAVKKILSLNPRPDMVITGGDNVMDVLLVDRPRADVQFKLLEEALKPLEIPVHYAVGNHDVYGWGSKNPATANEPDYGKKMMEERVIRGRSYYSFDVKGWHFIVLDSIGYVSNVAWRSEIDDAQLQWLKSDLEKVSKKTPIVITVHVPLFTAFTMHQNATTAATSDTMIVRNGKQVRDLFKQHNVKAVFQGHTHIVEEIIYTGTHYITSGAVCGDWWKGPRLGVHPEGFAVVDVDGANFKWEYVPYGWKARKA